VPRYRQQGHIHATLPYIPPDDDDDDDDDNNNNCTSESQGSMGMKVQGDSILVDDSAPTLLSPYMLPANVARVMHTS
jgi:hypothetical protein